MTDLYIDNLDINDFFRIVKVDSRYKIEKKMAVEDGESWFSYSVYSYYQSQEEAENHMETLWRLHKLGLKSKLGWLLNQEFSVAGFG